MMADMVSRYLYCLTVNNQYLGITVWTVYCPLLVCILSRPEITYKLTTVLFLLSLPVLLLASLPTASVPVLVMVAAVQE